MLVVTTWTAESQQLSTCSAWELTTVEEAGLKSDVDALVARILSDLTSYSIGVAMFSPIDRLMRLQVVVPHTGS